MHGILGFLGAEPKVGTYKFLTSRFLRFQSDYGNVITIIFRSALDSGSIVWQIDESIDSN